MNIKMREIEKYIRYWPDGNLSLVYYKDKNNLYQGIYMSFNYDGKLLLIDYNIDDRPEGEVIRYDY
jgi:hypothetical protein